MLGSWLVVSVALLGAGLGAGAFRRHGRDREHLLGSLGRLAVAMVSVLAEM